MPRKNATRATQSLLLFLFLLLTVDEVTSLVKPLEDSISWLNVNVSTPGRHLADEGRRRQRHIRADSTRTPAAETSTQGLGEGVGHGKRARATPRATVDYVPTNCFANTFFFVVNNFSICCCFAFLFYVLIFGVFLLLFRLQFVGETSSSSNGSSSTEPRSCVVVFVNMQCVAHRLSVVCAQPRAHATVAQFCFFFCFFLLLAKRASAVGTLD